MEQQKLLTLIKETDGLSLTTKGTSIKASINLKKPVVYRKSNNYPLNHSGYLAAVAWRTETIDKIKNGEPIKVATESMTIADALKETDNDPDDGWKTSTSNWCQIGYQKGLTAVNFFGKDKPVDRISLQDIKNYKNYLLGKVVPDGKKKLVGRDGVTLKASTADKYLQALNKMLNFTYEIGKYSTDSTKRPPKIKPFKKDGVVSAHRGFLYDPEQGINEEADFHKVCNQQGSEYSELSYLVRLGCLTGMRFNEIITLKCRDINLTRRTITLQGSNTKNKNRRSIKFDSETKRILKYFMGNRVGNQLVIISRFKPFLERDKKAKATLGMHIWNNSKVDRYFARVKKQLGITDENLTFHSSRNTFIYRALENNIKPHIVQKIVGHKSIEQTMQYVTQQIRLVSDADLEQVFNHKANQVNGVI